MRISKSSLVEPGRNTLYGAFAVAVSFFVFAYSFRIGQISILMYYAVWLPLVLVDYRFTLGRLARSPQLLAFAFLACLSYFWSDAPDVTLRAALQYLTHVVCAVIAARVIDARTLCIGAIAGIAVILGYSMLQGGYVYDALDGSYSFVGAFGSKNQLGFYASLGVLLGCYFALFLTRSRIARLLALGVVALSAASLVLSQSATSMLATPAAIAMVVAIAGLEAFSPIHRRIFFAAGLALAGTAVLAALNFGAADMVLGAFGKDSTLTGRTYLWQQGIDAAANTPLLGVGYAAYWVQGFSEAERLWNEFYIPARTGFHFHNTYIEALVETGYVGAVMIVLPLLAILRLCIARLLSDGDWTEALLQTGLLALLVIRSFFEVDILQPYVIGSFLLYYCWARAKEPAALRRPASAADWRPPSPSMPSNGIGPGIQA
ncbi:exopolysaccharide biosynthesis protein [Aminobacter sp. Y103A]|uniref:O-antigen ligase family protein n=1 Tax=unclassified Aminobacter TaxID=2644704 RepID=UPI0012B091FC|nr:MULTISPECIES: O-antigen ligase [unclassified Aminobacter]MRX36160.1 O-antigen ligase family protein [Aminobacter sp. MDW-2]QNH35440.1 O-antigen ligase family protein [Aminobacter sp. MDW-2]BBD40304.1 exopolysaccharide biosynthesis protein [Aminobacter sp. SS-2016]